MTEDISKNTLLVLVALTVVISVLGTIAVYDEANKARVEPTSVSESSSSVSGKISLSIAAPKEAPSVSGKVILNIKDS